MPIRLAIESDTPASWQGFFSSLLGVFGHEGADLPHAAADKRPDRDDQGPGQAQAMAGRRDHALHDGGATLDELGEVQGQGERGHWWEI